MSKVALITGIGGQDGSYLTDILLSIGYEVHGLYRHSSCDNLWRIKHHVNGDRLTLHQGDVTDYGSVERAVLNSDPNEIYHMADQDNVGWSASAIKYQMDVTYGGVVNVLEAARLYTDMAKVFIPVSATMFGNTPAPQNENTPLNPQSHYACAKAAAFHLARFYRQHYGMFMSCGIMYNHDSPRRGRDYLLQKICRHAHKPSTANSLVMGNLDLMVDIGHAFDYMKAVYEILQLEKPDDFVVSTGVGTTIREMLNIAYRGIKDPLSSYVLKGVDRDNQPTLVGDCHKLRSHIDWDPRSIKDTIDNIMEGME